MDAIIQKTGQIFYIINLNIRKYLYKKILRNHTSVVLFIFIFCLIAVLIGFFGLGYSIQSTIMYSLGFTSIIFLVLLFIGSYFEAKRLQTNELNSCFQFCHGNLNGMFDFFWPTYPLSQLISKIRFSVTKFSFICEPD